MNHERHKPDEQSAKELELALNGSEAQWIAYMKEKGYEVEEYHKKHKKFLERLFNENAREL